MPVYEVTFGSIFHGILPYCGPHLFRLAIARAVDSAADLRWGQHRRGFRRLLHPNGICLTGLWEITRDTAYSGYFRKGSRALAVARYSTCCTDTRRGRTRSLSLVGKLYPTTDPAHAQPMRTANFITQQDIGGDHTDFINDAVTVNAPDTTASRRGGKVPILILTGLLFGKLDREPSIRQLYTIAELGKPADEPTRAPQFMRLRVSPSQPRIPGEGLDFRDEIMAQIYDRGDPIPKRKLTFEIDVTDDGESRGLPIRQRRTFWNWQTIGRLTFSRAVASYNGDFVIHFNHPTWRADRNDPATATRVNECKIR